MESLLIIEDEKMIRKGIAAMAARSSVPIKEILECRNGEEALGILNEKEIDTVFTDIRMPKIDGIELVKQMENLPYHPDVVVISGYDDFNYAVEMLKYGVYDYLLKPVKRDKIEEILVDLERKQTERKQKREDVERLLKNQLKFLMSSDPDSIEWEPVEKQYRLLFGEKPYRLIVCAPKDNIDIAGYEGCVLDNIDSQRVLFIMCDHFDVWREQTEIECFGVSGIYHQLRECKKAYKEAMAARKEAFIKCRENVFFEDIKTDLEQEKNEKGVSQFTEQFVQQFSTMEKEEAVRRLKNLCFKAQHGQLLPEMFMELIITIQKRMLEVYHHMIPEEKEELFFYQPPLFYVNVDDYFIKMDAWLDGFSNCLAEQYISNQNKRKISEALDFISENYMNDLNMAMVSNHVSMNYSLFSIEFKNFTGVNFVNYLKEIRIKEAKRLLLDSDLKIQDISRMVGYENEKHFMKTFKNICGVSPSQYRNNQGGGSHGTVHSR